MGGNVYRDDELFLASEIPVLRVHFWVVYDGWVSVALY